MFNTISGKRMVEDQEKSSTDILKLLFILGTRPEITKAVAIISSFAEREDCEITVIVTGQQCELTRDALEDLSLRSTDRLFVYCLEASPEWKALDRERIERFINTINPTVVLVVGDTASALLGAETARRQGVRTCHIEAGIRLKIWQDTPEELTRRKLSQICDIHLAPTEVEKQNLINEGVEQARIAVIGNLSELYLHYAYSIIPKSLQATKSIQGAAKCKEWDTAHFCEGVRQNFILSTFHRHSSRNNQPALHKFLSELATAATGLTFILSGRPDSRWEEFYKKVSKQVNILVLPPVRPLQFQILARLAKAIITDSAGVEQESLLLGKRVLVVRPDSELHTPVQSSKHIAPPYAGNSIEILKWLLSPTSGRYRAKDWESWGASCVRKLLELVVSDGSLERLKALDA